MPIFEYECRKCGNEFEVLTRSDAKITCSSCQSSSVKKKFSSFAVNTISAKSQPQCAPACHGGFEKGSCGSGMCGIN